MSQACRLTVNGTPYEVRVDPGERLLDVLRNRIGLTGTKEGCGAGECGACTVIVDGRPVNACLYPAPEADGRTVVTIEGIAAPDGTLSPVQRAMVDRGGIQCGFCSPGMIVSAHALLARNSSPTAGEVRDALLGNLCRCTGYVPIVDAILAAAEQMRGARPEGGRG